MRTKRKLVLSDVTVGRAVRWLGYSVKETLIASERDRPDVQRRRAEWPDRIAAIPATRLVFVAETGTNVVMTRMSSRALVGERAFGRGSKNHSVNLTVVGAIARDGGRAMMAYEGGTTREAFLRFVREALVRSLRRGDVVVMNDLRSHYAEGVESSIVAVGARVLYQPPCSPELNPIEHAWSKLKAILRKIEARTISNLRRIGGRQDHSAPRLTDDVILISEIRFGEVAGGHAIYASDVACARTPRRHDVCIKSAHVRSSIQISPCTYDRRAWRALRLRVRRVEFVRFAR